MYMSNFYPAILSIATYTSYVASATIPTYSNSTINWFQCQQNGTWPFTCGTLAVPLDYTDSSSRKFDLQLLRIDATKQPKKGSILFNPGGPGGGTREFLAGFGKELLVATGGYFDLIAFDTRGVGTTLPFSCFDATTRATVNALYATKTLNSSDTALGEIWSVYTAISELCYDANKDIGEFLGTAFIARDMIQIVDALNEDGKLRFYGFSYGTILGATVAAMFPDRIDKMILDGVVNTEEWYAARNAEGVTQADKTVHDFLQACLDAPDFCPLAKPGATADELYSNLVNLLQETKYEPVVLGKDIPNEIITYGAFKSLIVSIVKAPMGGSTALTGIIDAIATKNRTAFYHYAAMFPPGSPPTFPELGPEALFGIQCGDVSLRSNNLNEIKPIVEEIFEASYWFGDYQTIFPVACSHWKFRAKERFYGPFVGKTQNPILFISSPYDVVTPMVSARNVSAGFDGSIVLEHRGFGHTSLSQPSRCVIDATRAYFVNGTLPSPDTVCEPDYSFFSNHTIVESYEQAEDGEFGTNGTGVVRREVEEISLGRFLGSFTSPFGLLRSPW